MYFSGFQRMAIAGKEARRTTSMLAAVTTALLISCSHSSAQVEVDDATPNAMKQLSLDELMNIEVTSVSRQPESYEEAPASISVITQDQIRRSGASSIPEALRLADNLEVAQKNTHDWAISARGFNTDLGNKLLVMIDGRVVYSPLFSGVFWNAQDYLMEDIDHIEVISGPGGTLWGANAVNGVINITTKSAKDTQGFYVEGGGGSELRDFGGFRYGGKLAPDVYFRVYGKYFDRGDEVVADGSPASDAWQMGQGGFRIDGKASPDDNFTLQGDIYGSELDIQSGGQAEASGGNVVSRWSHSFSDESDMTLQFYYDRTQLRDPLTLNGVTQVLSDDLDTYDVDFQHRFRLDQRNHIVWGLGYRFTHDMVGETRNLGFFPPVLNQSLFSGFIQDEINIVQDLNFTIGSKLEHNDYTGFEVEPSARLQWNFAEKQTLWAAVSRAVRTPSRIDRDLAEPVAPVTILAGSPTFISETVIAYELGYRARFGENVSTSATVFYNDYDNLRSTSITPGTLIPLYFQNNLAGYTYGLELSANYQVLSWWRLHAGYDLLEEHLRVKPGQFDYNKGLNETADPKHQFSVRSSMNLPYNVQFDAGLRFVDTLHNNQGPTVGTVPAYFELDMRLSWHPTDRLEFSVVGQNLLHDHHAEYGFPGPDREEIVRSVYGKVAWQF